MRRRFLRRRRFIVDPRLQGALLFSLLVQLLFFSFILVLALFLPPILALNFPGESDARALEAARHMLALDDRFWPSLGAAFVLVLLLALRTSHKIAGPLYRFRRVFESLLRGEDPGPVRLRKRDYLKPEAEFLERVARSVVEDRERLAALREGLRRCLDELDVGDGADVSALRTRLSGMLDEGDDA